MSTIEEALQVLPLPRYMNTAMLAECLGIHANTLRNWERKGLVPRAVHEKGRNRRWPVREIIEALHKNRRAMLDRLSAKCQPDASPARRKGA